MSETQCLKGNRFSWIAIDFARQLDNKVNETLQGYLAHKKPPPPPRLTAGPYA